MVDDTRIPLVLLPGSLCDEGIWASQIVALQDIARCEVITCGAHDSVLAMADDVIERVRAPRFALAGFSLGGFVALEIMRRAPERVSHLALLDTSARADHPGNEPVRRRNIDAFTRGASAEVLEAFADLLHGPSTPVALREQVRASMDRHGPNAYVPQQRAMMLRPDARATLEAVRCPLLILCGAEDRATPPHLHQEMAALAPHAMYVELAGIGHMTTLEAPDEVSRAMRRWLNSQ